MIQQLDLFGGGSNESSFQEEGNDKSFVAKPPIEPIVSKKNLSNIVYSDEKISVKIKPKVEVVKKPTEKKLRRKTTGKRGRKSFKQIDAELDLVNIPEDEELFTKQYYPISKVAEWFGVNTSLIRFWENEFDVLKPRKNRKGDRLFRPEDVKNLQLIYQLLRNKKYTIEGAKEHIKAHKKKADIQLQLAQTLQKFKGFLLEMRANLDA